MSGGAHPAAPSTAASCAAGHSFQGAKWQAAAWAGRTSRSAGSSRQRSAA